jgi:hypothetical protein
VGPHGATHPAAASTTTTTRTTALLSHVAEKTRTAQQVVIADHDRRITTLITAKTEHRGVETRDACRGTIGIGIMTGMMTGGTMIEVHHAIRGIGGSLREVEGGRRRLELL